MAIGYKVQNASEVPTPPAGAVYTFFDLSDGKLKKKDETGVITIIESGGSGVSTVFTRTGNVVAQSGDYAANQITYNPHGSIPHVQVQAAINHLDDNKAPLTHVGSTGVSQHGVVSGVDAGFMSPSDKTKLDGIASGATANDTDANLKDRANHTGTQAASTISDFSAAADARVAIGVNAHEAELDPHPQYTSPAEAAAAAPVQSVAGKTGAVILDKADVGLGNVPNVDATARANHNGTQTASTISDFSSSVDARISLQKGAANGLATLDAGSKIPAAQLPSYVDDVLEYPVLAAFPGTGENGKIYVDLSNGRIYRWTGSVYVEISPSPGSTDSVPEGSVNLYFTNGRASAAAPVQSVAGKTGAVTLGKSDVGLSNVDNTSDLNKPISTATQTALNGKQKTITSGTALPSGGVDGDIYLQFVP